MKQRLRCVLLIDDSEADNFFHSLALKNAHCTDCILIVETASEALDLLCKVNGAPKPELIFLDINMPGMDGWEFLEEYKKLDKSKQVGIIIVMLTTSENPKYRKKAAELVEVSGFITKPLDEVILNDVLHEHFADRF